MDPTKPVYIDAVRKLAEFLAHTLLEIVDGGAPPEDVQRLTTALRALSAYTLHEASTYSAPVAVEV